MSGTHLFYNGVLLRDCETRSWEQQIVYDESNTDVLYSKTTIQVESTLISLLNNSNLPVGTGVSAPLQTIAVPTTSTENIVERLNEIRWRLQETRKDFWFAMNGVTAVAATSNTKPEDVDSNAYSYRVLLAATGLSEDDLKLVANSANATLGKLSGFNDGGLGTPNLDIDREKVLDRNNGPKPLSVNVVKIFGGRALRVNFTIEVCRCFCQPEPPPSSNPNTPLHTPVDPPSLDATKVIGVISNRWSLTETMDSEWKTTHAIEGKLHVSDARYKPHAMRLIVTPRLFPYAKVASRTYATDRTGLTLAYRFEIKETGTAAPAGVADWDATYEEQVASGGKNMASVTVKLTGYTNPYASGFIPPNSPDPQLEQKRRLLQIAQRIVASRVRYSRAMEMLPGANPNDTITLDVAVVEQIGKPIIELRASFLYNDTAQVNGGNTLVSGNAGIRLLNMGRSIAGDLSDIQASYDARWWKLPAPFPWDVESERLASETTYGSYYDCYFQEPCSEWHSMPRGAVAPNSVGRDDADTGNTPTSPNPTADMAAASGLPVANLLFVPQIPATVATEIGDPLNTWWSDNQASFAYFQADIDTEFPIDSGLIQLPLSASRNAYPSGAVQTSTVVRLHAGIAQRIVTVICTREGDWPVMPEPTATVVQNGITEQFLEGKIVADSEKLMPDGLSFMYSMQVRWVYSMDRIPNQGSDILFVTKDPRDKTPTNRNNIVIARYFRPGFYY